MSIVVFISQLEILIMIMDVTEHLHITKYIKYTNNYTNNCKIIVYIPVFNEQQSIDLVVNTTKKFADQLL